MGGIAGAPPGKVPRAAPPGCRATVIAGSSGTARRTGENRRGAGSSSTPASACVGCKISSGSREFAFRLPPAVRWSPKGSLKGSFAVYCAGRTLGSIRVMFQPARAGCGALL